MLQPKEAIRTAWQLVGTGVAALVEKEGLSKESFEGALQGLVERGHIDAAGVSSITGLHQMFRVTEEPGVDVTQESAREFLGLAEELELPRFGGQI